MNREQGYSRHISYKTIENCYMDFDGDKDAFCKAYRENKDSLAERIREHTEKKMSAESATAEQKEKDLNKLIKELHEKLEREQEWRPYTEQRNVRQKDYEELRNTNFTKKLTDEEATEYINRYFGFEKGRIRVIHEVPVYEINRHNVLRQVGVEKRDPLYASSDWNYIRFDCADMAYELDNVMLRLFVN